MAELELNEIQLKILNALKKRKKLTYPEIVLMTNIPYNIVVDNVRTLHNMGKVEIKEVPVRKHNLKIIYLR